MTFPDSLTDIEEEAFENCKGLTSVDLSSTSLTHIKSETFENCTSLASILFPSTLRYISENAFFACTSLTSVDLSSTRVIEIDFDALHTKCSNPPRIVAMAFLKQLYRLSSHSLGNAISVVIDPRII